MSELKTKVTQKSVKAFIAAIPEEQKRKDAETVMELMKKITKEEPKMWGASIIGFGSYHYKSSRSKQEGDWPLTGFSPRKQHLSIYIMPGFKEYEDLLAKLGKHKHSVSCLSIKKLEEIDIHVLEKIIKNAFKKMKKLYKTTKTQKK